MKGLDGFDADVGVGVVESQEDLPCGGGGIGAEDAEFLEEIGAEARIGIIDSFREVWEEDLLVKMDAFDGGHRFTMYGAIGGAEFFTQGR